MAGASIEVEIAVALASSTFVSVQEASGYVAATISRRFGGAQFQLQTVRNIFAFRIFRQGNFRFIRNIFFMMITG